MNYIGKGIYNISDIHKITGLHSQSIRRWIKGYDYNYKGEKRHSSQLWMPELEPIDDTIGLSFKDLIEINFVQAFIKQGLSLKIIRMALIYAQNKYGIDHPFCSKKFLTDGRKIFLEIHHKTGEKILEELLKGQLVFKEIVGPFLKQLDFENDILKRWWPLTKQKQVVLDPERNFGQPIVAKEGILTEVLAKAYHVNGSFQIVSEWYNVSEESVSDAVEFQYRLAA